MTEPSARLGGRVAWRVWRRRRRPGPNGGSATSGGRRLSTALLKLALAVSLVGIAFAATYSSAPEEFSSLELRDMLLLGTAAHVLLLGAALLLLRSKLQNAVLALIVVVSVGSAYLIHTDLYLGGSRVVLWLIVLSVWAGVFAVLGFMDSSPWLRGGVPAAALLALGISAAPHLPFLATTADPASAARDYEELLNPIAFESTPNLYFLAFDGLGPQSLGQEYLGIDTTDMVDLVNAEFRRFPNMFSDSIWSLYSLNAMVYLERGIARRAQDRLGAKGHLTGEFPTPLFDLLRDNGYEMSFIYPFDSLGRSTGSHVDNVEIGRDRSICRRLDPAIAALAFWGYCSLPVNDDRDWYRDHFEEQLELILPIADRSGPQFVLTYFRLPEHTYSGFDYSDARQRDDYASHYVDSSGRAAVLLARLLDTLQARDPDAILFVFGDHGPRLTYSMEFHDDPGMFVKDRLGVLGGIYPRDACESSFDETLSHPYLSVLDAVHTILRCLSGGAEALAEPLAEPSERVMRDYRGIPNDDPERTLADYLYE